MSVKNAFYEELKKMGIDSSAILRKEFRKDSLTLYTRNKPVEIKDPYLIKLAKIADLNASYTELHRDNLLKRLYGIRRVYDGLDISYPEFEKKMSKKSKEELASELERLEKEHITNEKLYKDLLVGKVYYQLLQQPRYVPPQFQFENKIEEKGLTTEEILELIIIDPQEAIRKVFE